MGLKNKIAPSVMCCDPLNIGDQVKLFEKSGIDYLHIDIMDGSFVPNFALGADIVRVLKNVTDIPLDLHLMIEEPERHLHLFPVGAGDIVSIHYESTRHLQRAFQAVKDTGATPFLALNPSTPVDVARDVLDDIGGILIMAVNPGFAGQKMIPHTIDKISGVRAFLDVNGKADAEIEVDGNVSIPNGQLMRVAGANIFVLGTAALFNGESLESNIHTFRNEVC